MEENRPIIDDETGLVVNVVSYDTESDWQPPAGHSIGPIGGRKGDMWDGLNYTSPPVTVTTEMVSKERDRRIAQGYTAATSTGKSFSVQTRNAEDFRNIQALVSLGQVRQSMGDATPIIFRDADNVDQTLTPIEMIEVGLQAFGHTDAHYKASWSLKDVDPIPENYTDDIHWP